MICASALLSCKKARLCKIAASLLALLPATTFGNGAIDPAITSTNFYETICIPGYTKTVRPPVSVTNRIKKQMLRDTGIGESHIREYELDHVIPLALGGHPSRLENLQLQLWEGHNGAKRKDRIEVKMQCLVCSGQVRLDQAQREIANDWDAAYHRYASVKCNRVRNAPKFKPSGVGSGLF